jgi:hypothetical protein
VSLHDDTVERTIRQSCIDDGKAKRTTIVDGSLHDAVSCDNNKKTAHPATVPWSATITTTTTNKYKPTAARGERWTPLSIRSNNKAQRTIVGKLGIAFAYQKGNSFHLPSIEVMRSKVKKVKNSQSIMHTCTPQSREFLFSWDCESLTDCKVCQSCGLMFYRNCMNSPTDWQTVSFF